MATEEISSTPTTAPEHTETTSPHMQYVINYCAKWPPMEDKYAPVIPPDEGPLVTKYNTRATSYYFTRSVFIKRQPHADESGFDIYGNPAVAPYIAQRLRNEFAALQFVRANTSIPVPELLDIWEDPGSKLTYLKTRMVHDGIELLSMDKDTLAAALEAVTQQLETDVIPQLQKLRRRFMGSADPELPVTVPHWFWAAKDKRVWPRLTAKEGDDDFVFVHTDLDLQNIMVDPKTFRVTCIMDWETAGFFPASWELHKWKFEMRTPEKSAFLREAKKRELLLFGPEFVLSDKELEANKTKKE